MDIKITELKRVPRARFLSIPFENQDSDFCKLYRKHRDAFSAMHSIFNDDVPLPIVMAGEHLNEFLNTKHSDDDWDAYVVRRTAIIKELNHIRLVHLSFANLHIDEDNMVSLIVGCEGNSLQKYIPRSVRAVYHRNDDLIKKLLEPTSKTSDLWWLTAFAFVVPTFGSYK